MMKKLMAILVGIVGIVPFVANAEETANYYTYNKGDVVNFYGLKEDQDAKNGNGIETFIFEDKGATDEFVQAWTIGMTGSTQITTSFMKKDFKESDQYADFLNSPFVKKYAPAADAEKFDYIYKYDDAEKGLRLPTIEDMVNVFGATKVDGEDKYIFPDKDVKKYPDNQGTKMSLLDELNRVITIYNGNTGALVIPESAQNGIILNDKIGVTDETNLGTPNGEKFWVIKLTFDSEGKITDAEINAVPVENRADIYMVIPVVYFNKSADCHEHDEPEYCFLCGTTYKFGKGSEVDATCEKLVDVPKEECANVCYKCPTTDTANPFEYKKGRIGDTAFSTCEKVADKDCQPKTGKKSYILEFAIVAALCTISLLVVKRKELFKTM